MRQELQRAQLTWQLADPVIADVEELKALVLRCCEVRTIEVSQVLESHVELVDGSPATNELLMTQRLLDSRHCVRHVFIYWLLLAKI